MLEPAAPDAGTGDSGCYDHGDMAVFVGDAMTNATTIVHTCYNGGGHVLQPRSPRRDTCVAMIGAAGTREESRARGRGFRGKRGIERGKEDNLI